MSRDQVQDQTPIEGLDQLLAYFRSGEKPAEKRGVGTEHEKFIFDKRDGKLIGFDGPDGIEALLSSMREFGWAEGYDHGRVMLLERGDEAITLEPGGQFELSGGVKETIFDTQIEFRRHLSELKAVSADRFFMVGWGLNPFDHIDDIGWVPKTRYGFMRRYLATRGDLAHWMMKATCTVQANMDYTSEEDAADMVRTSILVSPIVHAIFAHSPIRQEKETGFQSYRGHIWTRTDSDRSGVPPFMYRDDWGYEEYLHYALDVPMFFIRRDDYIDMTGHSFRAFLADGHQGHQAMMGDFELHLSTIFPEVRMKKFVELRCGDGGGELTVLGLPALWKGLLYEPHARAAARDLLNAVPPEEHVTLFALASKDGLHGHQGEIHLGELAEELIAIASKGLDRIAERSGHPSEAIFLEELASRAKERRAPADDLRQSLAAADRMTALDKYDLLQTVDAAPLPHVGSGNLAVGSSS